MVAFSGGGRSPLAEKITLTTLKMLHMVEAVSVQNVATPHRCEQQFCAG
ncbi:hypothetical protein [Nitrosospira sp. Is2]|jgi:hypothetical protein|nr:hypothetical protein [Nitrosospira sp. Is2]WON75508.1 hypothetical protein R5L00_15010 [Nitrosospira sp. Is2]